MITWAPKRSSWAGTKWLLRPEVFNLAYAILFRPLIFPLVLHESTGLDIKEFVVMAKAGSGLVHFLFLMCIYDSGLLLDTI